MPVQNVARAPQFQAWIDKAKETDIDRIVRTRNIKLVGRPPELAGPCPQCGGTDRFSVHLGKQVFNCRGCGAKGHGAIDLVMFLDGCAFLAAVETVTGEPPPDDTGTARRPDPELAQRRARKAEEHAKEQEKRERATFDETRRKADKAAWLWGRREPVSDTNPAGLYLRKRGYEGQFPATLGYLQPNGKYPPAMIGAFGFCDEPEPGGIDPPAVVAGVHITRLTPDGGKAPIDPTKIMLGPMSGLPIVLAPVNDGLGLAITEGIEDGLSVFEETGLGVWAAGSAGNMPKIVAALPPYVECTTIFAHRDETGMQFAKEAARLIAAMGTEVHIKGRG
ncbi:MAG: toprim domain-containing protein [Methylocella sp.]